MTVKSFDTNFWNYFLEKMVGHAEKIYGGFSGQEILKIGNEFPQKECFFPKRYSFQCCSL